MRPRVQQLLTEHGRSARLITLTSRRQADRFIAQLEAETTARPKRSRFGSGVAAEFGE
jgi:hypothetical protein